MTSSASMKTIGLALIFAGTALLVIGLISSQAALWGASPGVIASGVVAAALSRKQAR